MRVILQNIDDTPIEKLKEICGAIRAVAPEVTEITIEVGNENFLGKDMPGAPVFASNWRKWARRS